MTQDRVRHPLDHSKPAYAPAPEIPDGRLGVQAEAPREPEVVRGTKENLTAAERRVLMAKEGTGPSGLGIRILSGAIYIAITAVCLLASDLTCAAYLAVLCAICASEYFTMLRADAKLPNEMIGIVGAACFPVATWLFGFKGMVVTLFLFFMALLCWYVFYQKARITDVAVSCFGALYTGLMMSSAMVMHMSMDGIWGGVLLIAILASIWGNDACAYLVGSKFGKHKMAPTISPKKSWEGFVGGIAFSVLAWIGISYIPGITLSLPLAIGFGVVCGAADVVGDLVESRIKRNAGFKDSGTIMPGHGGLLDRCDSQFTVCPIAGMGLVLLGCIPFVL